MKYDNGSYSYLCERHKTYLNIPSELGVAVLELQANEKKLGNELNSMIRAHEGKIKEANELAEDMRKIKVIMNSDLLPMLEIMHEYSFYDEELTKINWAKKNE